MKAKEGEDVLARDIGDDYTQTLDFSWTFLVLATKSSLWIATLTSCGSLLEIQNLGCQPRPIKSETTCLTRPTGDSYRHEN